MAQDDDEEDEQSSPDIPSFGDLVKEIRQRQAASKESAEAEDVESSPLESEDASRTSSAGDAPAIDADEDAWNWVDSGSGSIDSESTESESDVDSLWDDAAPSSESESDDQIDDPKNEALVELVQDASNILLVGPKSSPQEKKLSAQLSDIQTGEVRRRLLVTTNQSGDERLDSLKPFSNEPYDETFLIVVGDQVRSNNSTEPTTAEVDGETVVVETLTDPRDLTRLGILINKYLSEGDPPPVLGFHSLNDIQQFVGIEKLFRFLHILQSRVRSVDSHAHYQIDPAPLKEDSITTLKPLFDFTILYDETGLKSVEPR